MSSFINQNPRLILHPFPVTFLEKISGIRMIIALFLATITVNGIAGVKINQSRLK